MGIQLNTLVSLWARPCLVDIWQCQHWGGGEPFLYFLKALFTFLGPDELIILLEEFCHWLGNNGKARNKATVISCHSQKATDFTDVGWLLPFGHCFYFRRIHFYSFCSLDMPKEGNIF
jgi:hypothetical protein